MDLSAVLQQVEHGVLTPAQFKDSTLTNAVRFYAGDRPDFFAGTAVESVANTIVQTHARMTVRRGGHHV